MIANFRLTLWKTWPLAIKLMVAMTTMIILIVAVVTLLSIRREQQSFRAELERQASLMLAMMASVSADLFYTQDADALSDMLEAVGVDALEADLQVLSSGHIYDATGRAIGDAYEVDTPYNVEPDPLGQALVNSEGIMFDWQADQLLAGRAVVVGRKPLGAISVGLSTAPLQTKIKEVRNQGIVVGLAAIITGVALTLVFSRTIITNPLYDLVQATQSIMHGDLSQKIPAGAGDELALLGSAMEQMRTELQTLYQGLEHKVIARTQALQSSEERFREVVTSISDHIYVAEVTADGGIINLYLSPNIERLTGYSRDILENDRAFWLSTVVHPEDRAAIQRQIERLKSGQSSETVYRLVQATGQVIWVRDSARVHSLGDTTTYYGVISDITAHIEAERIIAQRASQLALINDLGQQITAVLELNSLLNTAAHLIQETFDYHHVALFLATDEVLSLKAVSGSYEAYFPAGHTQQLSEGINGWVACHGEKIVANDIDAEPRYISLIAPYTITQAELCLPIKIGAKTVGVLDIQSPNRNAFSENDVVVMEAIASQIAIAVENARLYESVQQELADRKQAEEALQEEKALLDALTENSLDSIYFKDRQCRLTRVSRKMINDLKLTDMSQVLGKTDIDLFGREFGTQTLADDQKIIATGNPIVGLIESRALENGGTNWTTTTKVPLRNTRGQITGLMGITREINDIKEIMEELRKFSRAVEQSASAIVIANHQGIIEYVNPAFTQTIGDTSEAIIGNNLGILKSGDHPPEFYEEIWATITKGEVWQGEIHNKKKNDDELYWENVIISPVKDEENEITHFVAIIDDITERMRAAELSAANVELAQATRLKDEFLASMSHELRTPLNAILGMAEVLRLDVYGPLNQEQANSVCLIEQSGSHLLALINDILDLSKIEANKLTLDMETVSVWDICEASLQLVKHAALKKQIKLLSSFDQDVTTIQADKLRLKQVLVNLLNNAVKFTPEGGRVGLNVALDPGQAAIHFTVWDTGIGISAEDQKRLFQPFVQVDSRLSRRYEGTGLGLSLVARLTQMHGGDVALESEVGQGSRFIVSLPYHPSQARPNETGPASPANSKTELTLSPPDEGKAVVLVAEDNETNIIFIRDFLRGSGYLVLEARNGLEAVELAKAKQPDIILMDIQMPDMDGLEATRCIREDNELARTPIIALTALAMKGDRERCLAAGADDYMSKPISLVELSKKVSFWLQPEERKSNDLSNLPVIDQSLVNRCMSTA